MEQIGGIGTLEPLSILFLIIVQLGGRYLKIDLTNAQQKLINNSLFQGIILFSIILMSTKNLTNSIIIIFVSQPIVNLLFLTVRTDCTSFAPATLLS